MLLSYYWQESLEIFSSSAHNIQGLNREFFLKMKETLTEKKIIAFYCLQNWRTFKINNHQRKKLHKFQKSEMVIFFPFPLLPIHFLFPLAVNLAPSI